MKKRLLAIGLALSLCLGMTGCQTKQPTETGENSLYVAGSYRASAQGYGGEVTVTMTFDEQNVTDVVIEAPYETETVGGAAAEKLVDAVKAANGGEIDGIGSATMTSNAVKLAVADCIAQAKGEKQETAEVKMKSGTYVGSAWGFNDVEQISVTVEVSENEILSIEVDQSNVHETAIKLENAAELLVPRILEAQSVAVDSITGATASGNGIKGAVTDALTQALIAGGASESAITRFQQVKKVEAKTETIDTDVLVVGMGGSGSYAALRVAEQMYELDPSEVKVLAIDKAANYGGTTVLTSEALAVNPPKMVEERNGGEDYVDAEALYQDWVDYTEGDSKEEMIRLMIDRSGEALDWLDENGFDFADPQGGLDDGKSDDVKTFLVKYQFAPTEGFAINKSVLLSYFDALYERYTEYGGEYLLETEATELIYDSENNCVTGVKAYNKVTNTTYTINAKAVILATGGFGGNGEMETTYLSNEHYPLSGVWNLCGSAQNDGKMIQSAIDIGAGTYNIGMTPVCHVIGTDGWLTNYPNIPLEGQTTIYSNHPAYWSEGDLPMMLLFYGKSFTVNSEGKRFLAENNLASFEAWKGGPDLSVIVTEAQIQEIAETGLDVDDTSMNVQLELDLAKGKAPIPRGTALPNALQVMEDGVKAGFISKADTIEELAEELGLEPAVLRAELDAYNEACRTGVDPLGKSAEDLVAMEEGPYYAVHAGMYCYGTCAGLDIDETFHVLQSDGETQIGGLYAIGADGQGVLYTEKKAYVTYGGADNGWALTSAYVCGKQVVDDLRK